MKKLALLFLVLVGAGASTAALAATSTAERAAVSVVTGAVRRAAPRGSAEGPLTNLRICSYTAFSKGHRCTKDERETVIYSNTIACSVDVTIRPGAMLRLRLGYEGQTVYESEGAPAPGFYTWWARTRLFSNVAEPGGTWTCEFQTGSFRAEASVRSGGPTGTIVDVEACPGKDAFVIRLDPLYAVCRADVSGNLVAPNTVVCDAVLPSAIGSTAEIEFLRRSAAAPDGFELVGSKLALLSAAVWQLTGAFSRDGAVTGRLRPVGSIVPPGDYVCRFVLDGQTVADRKVHVTAT